MQPPAGILRQRPHLKRRQGVQMGLRPDDEGRYEVRLAPGEYEIRDPFLRAGETSRKIEPLRVDGTGEVVRDFDWSPPSLSELSGVVVDASRGHARPTPIAGGPRSVSSRPASRSYPHRRRSAPDRRRRAFHRPEPLDRLPVRRPRPRMVTARSPPSSTSRPTRRTLCSRSPRPSRSPAGSSTRDGEARSSMRRARSPPMAARPSAWGRRWKGSSPRIGAVRPGRPLPRRGPRPRAPLRGRSSFMRGQGRGRTPP